MKEYSPSLFAVLTVPLVMRHLGVLYSILRHYSSFCLTVRRAGRADGNKSCLTAQVTHACILMLFICAPPASSAVEEGTHMLELDCHLTHDGHVVVSHDENLLRQTGHDVTISSLKLQVGGQILHGHWLGQRWRGQTGFPCRGFLDYSTWGQTSTTSNHVCI